MMRRGSGEDGMALLVVMVLMGIMLTAGFAIASSVDTQTRESRVQRVRDSTFNLAESALNAQVVALAREPAGVGDAATQYTTCTPATPSVRCPQNAALVSGGSPDLRNATWETSVRDNGPGESGKRFYSEATTIGQPGYDANADGRVWVRAKATTDGRSRTLVGLVRFETQAEDIPRAALITGRLDLANNGNKDLIAADGGQVAVRCTPQPNSTVCLGHTYTNGGSGRYKSEAELLKFLSTQITGAVPTTGYQAGNPQPAMTPDARERLKATAMADGTYFPGCPSSLTGRVVYVENATGCQQYSGDPPPSDQSYNTAQAPGMLLVNAGSIQLGGNAVYHGVIYAVNATNLTTQVVTTQGKSRVEGGVLIDGLDSVVTIGASGLNLKYDKNAFGSVRSYGSAGVVQNTFREIQG